MSDKASVAAREVIADIVDMARANPNGNRGFALSRDEAIENGLVAIRTLPPAQGDEHIADVWHEGSKSFYRAKLLKQLTSEEALHHPLDIHSAQGDGMRDAKQIVSVIFERVVREWKEEPANRYADLDLNAVIVRTCVAYQAALASHPDRQPGMTDEFLALRMIAAIRAEIPDGPVDEWGSIYQDGYEEGLDDAIAAIKRASQRQ